MEIYIMRHGAAADRTDPAYPDDADRPLTKEGSEKVMQIACALRKLDVSLSAILTSPLVRAKQTADLVAKAYGIKKVVQTGALSPEASTKKTISEIRKHGSKKSVLIVGHEPNLSILISVLLTGKPETSVVLKKGGICLLRAGRLSLNACAALNWLMTSKQLRAVV